MADDPQRTVHAQAAFQFADVFTFKFQNMSFGVRRLRLAEPEFSTDGGRKARQSIVLEAPESERRRPIVCGWVDVPKRASEVRSYAYVRQQLEQRGEALDLGREDWERLVQELSSFLRLQQLDPQVADAAPARPAPARAPEVAPPQGVAPLLAMLAMGILIGFALGYLVFGLRVVG